MAWLDVALMENGGKEKMDARALRSRDDEGVHSPSPRKLENGRILVVVVVLNGAGQVEMSVPPVPCRAPLPPERR